MWHPGEWFTQQALLEGRRDRAEVLKPDLGSGYQGPEVLSGLWIERKLSRKFGEKGQLRPKC